MHADHGERPQVQGVHHAAYRCRDAEETRAFYEDVLGFPLTMALEIDEQPTTGDPVKYMHVFFDIGGHEPAEPGSIAFFELPDHPTDPAMFERKWGFDVHLAMRVPGHDALAAWKDRLEAAGLEVDGPIPHGICTSIYFWDPNGYRLEFTAENDAEKSEVAAHAANAHANLEKWKAWKAGR